MRCFSLLLLAGAILCQNAVGRADDPAPVTIKDGISVTATGNATGAFDRHFLTVGHKSCDSSAQYRLIAALKALGFSPDGSNSDYVTVPLPLGPCDGSRFGKVSRVKLMESLERAGLDQAIQLYSVSSRPASEELERRAVTDAIRSARSKADAFAKAGGGKLGKLLGIEKDVSSGAATRILIVDKQETCVLSPGGVSATVTARFSLR